MKRIFPALLAVVLLSGTAGAQEWGTLSGTFIYDGTPPDIKLLDALCGAGGPPVINEGLLVDEESGGIANVVVMLSLKGSDEAPEAHPDYEETADADVTLDNVGCRFEPHICVLRTTQKLVVTNNDPEGHNVKLNPRSNPSVNLLLPPRGSAELEFPAPEQRTLGVSCGIHPYMKGFLFVVDHPYIAVTDENGHFEIANLPAGDWTFQVWQESVGFIGGEVQVDGETQEWSRRGQFEITIEPGDNDMGDILVPTSVFE